MNSAAARRAHGYQHPNAARLEYTAALRRLVKQTWQVVVESYADVLKSIAREDDLRRALTSDVRVKLFELVAEKAPTLVKRVGEQVLTFNLKETKRVLGIDPRIDPGVGFALDEFRRENVRLITSIAEQQLGEVEKIIAESFGLRYEEISAKLQERFGVSESRGDLIARDQTLKLNGDLTRIRQTNAGISEYIWTGSRDERERPEHLENEGKTFRWDVPPSNTGHPSEDVNCRCVAYPVVPGLDEEG